MCATINWKSLVQATFRYSHPILYYHTLSCLRTLSLLLALCVWLIGGFNGVINYKLKCVQSTNRPIPDASRVSHQRQIEINLRPCRISLFCSISVLHMNVRLYLSISTLEGISYLNVLSLLPKRESGKMLKLTSINCFWCTSILTFLFCVIFLTFKLFNTSHASSSLYACVCVSLYILWKMCVNWCTIHYAHLKVIHTNITERALKWTHATTCARQLNVPCA